MKLKFLIIHFLVLIILFNFVYAGTRVWSRTFVNKGGNELKHVQVLGYICNNANCGSSVGNVWANQPLNSGNKNYLNLNIPTSNNYYIIRLFAENYEARITHPHIYSSSGTWTDTDIFYKKDNCGTSTSLSVANNIGEWLPLTIDTNTNMDSTTKTFYDRTTDWYFPPEFNRWLSIKTNISVEIKDKETNDIVYEDLITKIIYSGDPVGQGIRFNWTTDDSYPGNFTVTIRAKVSEPMCNLNKVNNDMKFQDIEIFPALPNESCVIVADPLTFTPSADVVPEQNVEIGMSSYYYYMDKKYKGEIDTSINPNDKEWYDVSIVYSPITVNYNIDVVDRLGNVERVLNGGLIESFTGEIINAEPTKGTKKVTWTPSTFGEYTLNLDISSTDALCELKDENDNPTGVYDGVFDRASRVDSFTVGVRDVDKDTYYEDVDCDDNDKFVYPGAPEICDLKDNDCDASNGFDDDCECVQGTTQNCGVIYQGVCGNSALSATCNNGEWDGCPSPQIEDCENGYDDDCDGSVDCIDSDCSNFLKELINYYPCKDFQNFEYCKEGFHDINQSIPGCEYECTKTGVEICDDTDNDCDGLVDENVRFTYYEDNDEDGYGNLSKSVDTCLTPKNYVNNSDDCNDNNVSVNPDIVELCDGVDNNCDGSIDEGCTCTQGQEFKCDNQNGVCSDFSVECNVNGIVPSCDYTDISTYEVNEQTCDGLDNDCDSKIDELPNCCDEIKTPRRVCRTDTNCPGIQGTELCVNHQWTGKCSAECTQEVKENELTIIYPKEGSVISILNDGEKKLINYVGNNDELCQYKFNKNAYLGLTKTTSIRLNEGEQILFIKCGDKRAQSKFYVKKITREEININQDPDLKNMSARGVPQDAIDNYEATKDNFDVTTGVGYEDGSTVVSHSIKPQGMAKDASFYLEIPKCLAEYVDEITFENENYEIIQDDPLIAWHFVELHDQIDISYKVHCEIPEDCLSQIKSMVLMDLLKNEKNDTTGLGAILIPALIIMVIAGYFVVKTKTIHFDNDDNLTEEQEEKKLMLGLIKQKVRETKELYKKKDDQINYIKNLNLTKHIEDEIIKKL
jgi:hypothetical protein